jgi:hypothetical protein
MILVAAKKCKTKKIFPLLFWCYWFWDQRSGIRIDKNQEPGSEINIPDPQHFKYFAKLL